MTTPSRRAHVGVARAPLWSASWWLRFGQAVLFIGLLIIASLLPDGGAAVVVAWPIALLTLLVFVLGLQFVDRLGTVGLTVWMGILFALSGWTMWISPAYLWIAFPLWLLGAALLPLLTSLLLTAVSLAMIVTVLTMAGGGTIGSVLGPLSGALIAVGFSRAVLKFEHEVSEHRRLLTEVLLAHEETARLQREAGQLAERTRLAHDIHDTLAQGFSSIVLLARAAGRKAADDPARDLIAQIEATATENLAESRRVVYALAPEEAGAGGLAAPLRRLTAEVAEALGAQWDVTVDPELPRLATSTEVALLRAAQNALANVRQHSRAGRVGVELARAGDHVHLDVVDDGVGFDPAVTVERTTNGGYGLRALRERLADLGGELTVESEPGGGTAVTARLPLVRADEALP
ncbi:sensor histidine kinase [Tessaracoccus sp. ZS01]|uniref:sensor histidine kinase n=1 Tax=Tessaracoccus sp. ZS01 TaxID=1906324 RepID=UPI00117CF21B|nr:sensor histidine kinase [Tessaracoccus sp. ZS01]